MITTENEYYIRFVLLLIEGGTNVLRLVLKYDLEKKKVTFADFLSEVKDTIQGVVHITKKQLELLYPVSKEPPDLNKCDISILAYLLNEFLTIKGSSESKAVNTIKIFRNDFFAHPKTASLDAKRFTSIWNKLSMAILTLSHDFTENERERFKETIERLSNDALDINSAVETLKTLDQSNEFYENINIRLTQLDQAMQYCHKDIELMKKQITEIQNTLEIQGLSTKVVNTVFGSVRLIALEQRTVDETERVLLSVTKESLSHSESLQPHQTVRKAVDNLIQDMKDKGLEVEDVSKGSIVFTIKCQSFEGLIALIDYFDSPINNHLDAISRALSEITGQKIEVHAMILTDRLSEELRKHERCSKTVKVAVKCSGLDSLKTALDVFGSGDAARNSFSGLQGALSQEVGKPINLQTAIDLEAMQIAIDNAKKELESWDRCIERKSESDANILLEREIYPSKNELNKACHVFGRDSKIISHICSTISQHIKKQFKNVIDVFPSYKEDHESIIFLVIVKKKSTFSVFKDYEYCIRCENDVSTEDDFVAEFETKFETMSQFDNETFEKLRKCINNNANDLLGRHSNLNVILPSLVKSVGNRTGRYYIKRVPCIALYVTVKGCIPLNETPFQKNINGFPTDVLEGKFEPFMNGPNEYHEHLKIGLAIHANDLNTDGVLGGTLGGFIDHSTHGLCGITCAHVVYSPAELMEIQDKKQNSLRKKVYQPIGKSSSAFGEVVQAVYDKGGSCTAGMEVALISIQKRQPKNGSFPETFTDFEEGFDARNPLCFNSGAVCETSEIKRRIEVYKFGMTSGITRGSFALQGAVVRKSQMQGDCHGFGLNLMNQLLVLQIGEKPFAEHGDSGALVLTEGGQDSIAIGIVEGGMNRRRVFVTPICDILKAFGCTESKMHQFMPKCTQLLPSDNEEDKET